MINRRSGISTVVAAGAAVAVLMSGCLRGNRCGHTCVSTTNQVQPQNEVSHSPRCELHPNSLTCSCRKKQRTIYTRERVALANPYNLAATKTGCGCSDVVVNSTEHAADHSTPETESNPTTTPEPQEKPAPGAPHLIDPPVPTSMTSEIENAISHSAQPNFISQTVSSRVTLPVRTDLQRSDESIRETVSLMQPPVENEGSEESATSEEKLYYTAKDSEHGPNQSNSTSVSLANDSTPTTDTQSDPGNHAQIGEQTVSQPYKGPIVDPMLGEEATSTLEFVKLTTQSDQPIHNDVNIDQLANQIVNQIQSQQANASDSPSPELATVKNEIDSETNPFQVASETNSVLADLTDSDEPSTFTTVPQMNSVNARADAPKVTQNETSIKTDDLATQAENAAEPTPVLPNTTQANPSEQVVLRATAGNDPVAGQKVRVAELVPHATTNTPAFPSTDAAELEFMIRPLPHMESKAYVHSPSEYEFRTVPSYHMPTLRAVPEMKKRDHLPSVFKMRSIHSGPEPKRVANNYFEVNYPEFSPVPSPQFNPLERGQRETHSVEPVPVIKPLPKVESEEVKIDTIRGLTQRPEDRDPIR